VRWSGRSLRVSDGSCFCQAGSKTTRWRLHAVYDLGRGGFSHFALADKHGAEAIDRGAPIAGEIRIGESNLPVPRACTAFASRVLSKPISSSGSVGMPSA
jgi:hypothetical protein